MRALFDEGSNALLPCLLPDLQKVRHAHAHQPDFDGQLLCQQAKGHCLYLCSCADVLRQALSPGAHLKSCGLQLQSQRLSLEVLPRHVTSQMLSNLSTLQWGQPLEGQETADTAKKQQAHAKLALPLQGIVTLQILGV